MVASHWEVQVVWCIGAVISILFLLALGCLNLAAVLRAGRMKWFSRWAKGRLLGRLRHVSHPALIAGGCIVCAFIRHLVAGHLLR